MSSSTSLSASVASLSVATPWVVQKFGGTSVGKFPQDIADKIVKAYSHDGYRVAVVCSARSTNTKEEGTTTRLLQAADYAIASVRGGALAEGGSLDEGSVHPDDVLDSAEIEAAAKEAERQCTNKIEAIRESHLEVARLHIKSPELRKALERSINKECDLIIGIMSAVRVLDEISSRTLDSIISAGEKLACLYMAALINDHGLKAQYIDLSHIVPSTYKSANPTNKNNTLDAEFYDYVKLHIKHEIERKCTDGEIPVITGFFGVVPGGLINGVGRGYTDFCAALAAVALKAEELQIWKEVDGIFTADPRKVPTARLLSIITPEEAAELTYYGSEVIHPFTMEQVINARIPIRIKNVMNPTGSGTVIYPDDFTGVPGHATPPHPPKALERVPSSFFNVKQLHKGPTAVTTKNNILVLNIHSNHKDRSHGFLAHVFQILDQWKLVVDLISTSEVRVSMALHSNLPEKRLKQALNELRKYGAVDVTRKLCIVSLVGKNMKSSIGIAGQMFETLGRAGINIEMISQGASEINISTVIDQKDAIKALNVLHQTLLNRPVGRTTPSFVGVGDV